MADKPPTLPPQAEPFPGSRTPGWNDPPTLQYNPLSGSGRTRLNLNRRVAFPLQQQATTVADTSHAKPMAIVPPNQQTPISLPPSSGSTHPIAVVHPMPNVNFVNPPNTSTNIESNSRTLGSVIALPADAREYSMRVLRAHVPLVIESTNVRREEIERRLCTLDQLWESGSLSTVAEEKVYRIAKAISDNNFHMADEIYTALVANHFNECRNEAAALRHIVLTVQPINANNDAVTVVPAMLVPDIQNETSNGTAANSLSASDTNTGCSSIQHI